MKRITASWLCLALLPWSLASADLPYTFKAGDPIRASELNANFQYVESLAASGSDIALTRRRTSMTSAGFRDVVTVPDTATNGWLLRSYVTGCGTDPILRIDDDASFTMDRDAVLLVRPGETLRARCPVAATEISTVGYFMFHEQ
jgi:hypothetical protein